MDINTLVKEFEQNEQFEQDYYKLDNDAKDIYSALKRKEKKRLASQGKKVNHFNY